MKHVAYNFGVAGFGIAGFMSINVSAHKFSFNIVGCESNIKFSGVLGILSSVIKCPGKFETGG